MSDVTYLSAAQTAKLIRAALKAAFPGVNFSVRSRTYSMGASIDVRWDDGPTSADVEKVAKRYQGASFDGMIDLKTSLDHWLLPDGSVVLAHDPGTEGSGGIFRTMNNPSPDPAAKRVNLGADHVFCERSISPALLSRIHAYADRRLPADMDNWSRERAIHGIKHHAQVRDGALFVSKGA